MIYEGVIRTRKQSSVWSYTVSRFARILSAGLVHTHTHTRLTALCPGLPGWAGTRTAKPIWILLKQETVSGTGISWAICKSAPCSRQITMPVPHHSFFTGRMPFLPPNQQRQSTEGVYLLIIFNIGNSVTQKILYQQVSNIAKKYYFAVSSRHNTWELHGQNQNWSNSLLLRYPLLSRLLVILLCAFSPACLSCQYTLYTKELSPHVQCFSVLEIYQIRTTKISVTSIIQNNARKVTCQ